MQSRAIPLEKLNFWVIYEFRIARLQFVSDKEVKKCDKWYIAFGLRKKSENLANVSLQIGEQLKWFSKGLNSFKVSLQCFFLVPSQIVNKNT